MKLQGFKTTEVEGDDFQSQDVGIKASNIGFVFDLLSSQMYKRPIQSIVREITSNCFDSHIEAKVTDAVIIKIDHDVENGWFISFIDQGVGLSPDRIQNIYLNLGESTKRESDDQLGMWGLGSKSPFAYRDDFHIKTHYNGVTYEYIFYKAQNGVPKLDLIVEYEEVRRNGTDVKIYMKGSTDIFEFETACKTDLIYFDSTLSRKFNNVYSIYEKSTFKFRPDTTYSNQLHICIGKVAYPIDWNSIGIEPIMLPLGLKFKIGDLPITPERESVRYVK